MQDTPNQSLANVLVLEVVKRHLKVIESIVIHIDRYNYNVLYSGGSAQHVSGVLTSLSYVLTLSNALAQLPSGQPGPLLHLRVYAGLTELSLMNSSDHRDVLKIKVSHTPYIVYVQFHI